MYLRLSVIVIVYPFFGRGWGIINHFLTQTLE